MVKFTGLDTPKGLGDLNGHLLDKSYIEGYTPSSADSETFQAFTSAPDATKYVNVGRWYNHIKSFSDSERGQWTLVQGATTTTTATSEGKEKKDEDFDLFGEDEEADAEWEKETQRRADEHIAKRKAENEAKGKAPVLMKSAVVIDVKPWEDTTDLAEMEKMIRDIAMEGLEWKASKLMPIGYGIRKLQISCHIVDEQVSVDEIQERIEEFADHVQSTDVVTFTKL